MHRNGSAKGILGIGNVEMIDAEFSDFGDWSLLFFFFLFLFWQSISMNDIMDKSTFSGDQRSFALEAIRRYKPDFVPVYTPPNVQYDNELVNFMNTNLRNIEEKPQSLVS